MALRSSLSFAAACALLLPTSAVANTATCADRTLVVEALMERFGEEHFGHVRSDSDELLEIFSNASSQTWTILVTLPDRGLSCLVASGTGEAPLAIQLAALGN